MDPIVFALPSVGLRSADVALGDIGTAAVLGGLLFEAIVRLAPLVGWRPSIDGWREGMFFGALFVLVLPLAMILGLAFEAKVQARRRGHRTRSH